MNKNDHDQSAYLFGLVAFAPIAFILADLLERIREFFIGEWPYVSWGLLIVATSAGLILVYYQFIGEQKVFERELRKQIQSIQTLCETTDRLNGHKGASIDRRLDRIQSELNAQERTATGLSKKLKELLEQKGPIAPPLVVAETPEAVNDAIDDFISGIV